MVNIFAASAAASLVTTTFDYAILGGGTAGLTVASRLTENPAIKVLVLEAGTDQTSNPDIYTAGAWVTTYANPSYNWGFTTVPQTHAAGQTIDQPRGKVLGGCSATNAMEWTIASKAEYDALESAFGNSGWNFDSMAKYFKKAQTRQAQTGNPLFPGAGSASGTTIGTSGPLKTSWNLWYSSLINNFLDAVYSLGFSLNTSPDTGDSHGVSNAARTVDNGNCTRQHSASTYLAAASGRSNLFVLTGVQATKIVFGSSKVSGKWVASGVQFTAGSSTYTANFSKEVVVSAGAFMTPQILELSGIGKASVLSTYGITQLVDLPVGENLQDHLMINMQFYLTSSAQSGLTEQAVPSTLVASGMRTPGTCGTGTPFLWAKMQAITSNTDYNALLNTINGYINSGSLTPLELKQFQLQAQWLSANVASDAGKVTEAEIIFAAYPGTPGLPLPDGSIGMWMPVSHVHPLSRGSVHIQSSNALTLPKIDPNYLARDYDLRALRGIVKFGRTLATSGSLGSAISGPIAPPASVVTDADLDSYIKSNIATVFHPVGTAAMASRTLGGVVDSTLIVYDTKNVRVVDASIWPMQFAATTQASVYAAAEKAACMMQPTLSNC